MPTEKCECRSSRHRWQGVLFIIGLFTSAPVLGQDTTEGYVAANRVEGRISGGTGVEVQYSRFVATYVSLDALFQTGEAGPSIALTVFPFNWLFGQARIGVPLFKGTTAPDGPPPFDPDYMVGLTAGVLFHVPRSRVYTELAAGRLLVIQENYCPTCGGFLPAGASRPEQALVRRQEALDLISLGVGLDF
jgi:hypothetical protein